MKFDKRLPICPMDVVAPHWGAWIEILAVNK